MHFYFKLLFGILFLPLLTSQYVSAQIFSTKADIIKDNGYAYTAGVSDDGFKYLIYVKNVRTKSGRSYEETSVYYFITSKDKKEICHRLKKIVPSSETNILVKSLKDKFVELSDTMWKDYENNIIYGMDVKNGSCIIQAEFRVD